jgi:DNA polymerase-3 subunit beta
MKFSVSRDALHEAITLANLASKGGSDVLSLTVANNKLALLGSSGNVTLALDIPVSATTDGAAVVPGRFFQQVVSSIPAQTISVEMSAAALAVSGGASAFSVRTIAGAQVNHIQIPAVDAVSVTGDLIEALAQVSIAASSKSGVAPALTGVLLTASETSVEVAATDSYRVAVRALEASALPAAAKSLIPGGVIELLNRLMAKRGNLTLRLGDTAASFHADGAVLTTRLIDGGFPQYQKVIPAVEGTVAHVSRDALIDVLQRARLVNDARVAVAFSDGSISVSASSAENDGYAEALTAEVTGDEVSFTVNTNFLVDGLRAAPTADIEIVCSSSSKPVLIQAKGSDAFKYVVMPVRV